MIAYLPSISFVFLPIGCVMGGAFFPAQFHFTRRTAGRHLADTSSEYKAIRCSPQLDLGRAPANRTPAHGEAASKPSAVLSGDAHNPVGRPVERNRTLGLPAAPAAIAPRAGGLAGRLRRIEAEERAKNPAPAGVADARPAPRVGGVGAQAPSETVWLVDSDEDDPKPATSAAVSTTGPIRKSFWPSQGTPTNPTSAAPPAPQPVAQAAPVATAADFLANKLEKAIYAHRSRALGVDLWPAKTPKDATVVAGSKAEKVRLCVQVAS
jgi:hypothetical protein